jgi:hypothetical protein
MRFKFGYNSIAMLGSEKGAWKLAPMVVFHVGNITK